MATGPHRLYHHWISASAPALRRLISDAVIGVIVALAIAPFVIWPLALLVGWDAAGLTFLVTVLPVIARADGARTKRVAMREDETRDTASLLVQASCAASLVSVALALGVARHESGGRRALIVTIGIVTIIFSWTVVNSVFTLRYADLFYRSANDGKGGINFGYDPEDGPPNYLDFAYLAFTIGMTYQVSDTALRDRRLRRTVLYHAILSYFFGVVIVATGVNVIANLFG
ncbi:MAG TPA: DUF1345 domain-containing protein [Acidimicrobiales bacterium]